MARPARGRAAGDPVILAGDIGGTNTRLAWFDVVRGALVPGESRTYPSQQHSSLDSVVTAFLRDAPGKPDHVCVGVAGPVRGGRVDPVNLAWDVDGPALAARLGGPQVLLLNDLEANPDAGESWEVVQERLRKKFDSRQ